MNSILSDSVGADEPSAWQVAVYSQRGRRHAAVGRPNEDAVACTSAGGGVLAVAVADGVGSGQRGDMASDLVARHWVGWPVPAEACAALVAANQALIGSEAALAKGLWAAGEMGHGASGSMLVGAWLFPLGDVVLGHVGDCRAYRIRRGELQALTQDHSYQNLGLIPPSGRLPEHPARMVGGGMMGPPDARRTQLAQGDLLLLCSDGLHGAMLSYQFQECIKRGFDACHTFGGYRKGLLQAICGYLSKEAVVTGGNDDISMALAAFEGGGKPLRLDFSAKGNAIRPPDWSDSLWPSDISSKTAS